MGARNKLQEQLHMIGCKIIEIKASHEEPSIIHQILKREPAEKTVFFVFRIRFNVECAPERSHIIRITWPCGGTGKS